MMSLLLGLSCMQEIGVSYTYFALNWSFSLLSVDHFLRVYWLVGGIAFCRSIVSFHLLTICSYGSTDWQFLLSCRSFTKNGCVSQHIKPHMLIDRLIRTDGGKFIDQSSILSSGGRQLLLVCWLVCLFSHPSLLLMSSIHPPNHYVSF